jgi:hypothetical protein
VHAIILKRGRGSGIFFEEMQNGAIWGHFKFSFNIESSTILMTLIDKNFLKLSKICPSCLSRYEHRSIEATREPSQECKRTPKDMTASENDSKRRFCH